MNGSFIETFLEKSTNIPRDIARNFKLVKELDDKANSNIYLITNILKFLQN